MPAVGLYRAEKSTSGEKRERKKISQQMRRRRESKLNRGSAPSNCPKTDLCPCRNSHLSACSGYRATAKNKPEEFKGSRFQREEREKIKKEENAQSYTQRFLILFLLRMYFWIGSCLTDDHNETCLSLFITQNVLRSSLSKTKK